MTVLDTIRALHVQAAYRGEPCGYCIECGHEWPCATTRLLDQAPKEE